MQRVAFKNSRGLRLVGRFHPAPSARGIILAHGATGDKSELGKFDAVAGALNKRNFNVLRFDFSGCGESDDDALTIGQQDDDLRCAIDLMLQRKISTLGIMGYSLGALIAANVWDGRIQTMVFWAPVSNKRPKIRERFSQEQLRELDKTGKITRIKDYGVRRKFTIDGSLLEEQMHLDQGKLLSRIKCPLLIIHGSEDQILPIADSQRAMQFLSVQSRLEVVEGADHYLKDGVYAQRFIDLTVDWFVKNL